METFFLCLAIVNFIAILGCAIQLFVRMRSIRSLKATSIPAESTWPLVSIVFAARNEQAMLEEAVRLLLGLDYPDLEVIAVDDRSEDHTGRILDRLALENSRLKVLHVSELPEGWLGKTHALWLGAKEAQGEILLFTDADVMMAPSAVRAAVARMQQIPCDHFTLAPDMIMPGWLLNALLGAYMLFFNMHNRPWRARNPRSRSHIGIGAFQLMRAQVYHQIGSFEAIRLRPDDDMKLAKLVKIHGFRQEFEFGYAFVSVHWYASVRELISGLTKNTFAGLDYQSGLLTWGLFAQLLFFSWPFAAVFFPIGPARWIYLATAILILLTVWDMMRRCGAKAIYALGFPVAHLLFMYIQIRAMLLNLVQGGIVWRGTKYPLRELRKNKIEF